MRFILVTTLVGSILFCSQAFSQSEGCNTINGLAVLPASAQLIDLGANRAYSAGETISVSATTPGTTTNLAIEQNGTVVATAPFPGTVSYRIPSSGSFTIRFITDPLAVVTFTSASCAVASVPATPAWSLAILPLALLALTFLRIRKKKLV